MTLSLFYGEKYKINSNIFYLRGNMDFDVDCNGEFIDYGLLYEYYKEYSYDEVDEKYV